MSSIKNAVSYSGIDVGLEEPYRVVVVNEMRKSSKDMKCPEYEDAKRLLSTIERHPTLTQIPLLVVRGAVLTAIVDKDNNTLCVSAVYHGKSKPSAIKDDYGPYSYSYVIYTSEKHRGLGLGTKILRHMVQFCSKVGCQRLRSYVGSESSLLIQEKLGFEFWGILKVDDNSYVVVKDTSIDQQTPKTDVVPPMVIKMNGEKASVPIRGDCNWKRVSAGEILDVINRMRRRLKWDEWKVPRVKLKAPDNDAIDFGDSILGV